MTKRWRMHEILREAGREEPPAPRPEFVRDLEARLDTTRVVAAPPATSGRWRVVGAIAAAAAVIVAVLVLQTDDGPDQQVTTEPATSSTSTSSSSTTTTNTTSTTVVAPTTVPVFVPAITTTTTAAPPPPTTTTTTALPPPTTTTTSTPIEPTTTTSTTTPPQQNLRLACATTEAPEPTVICEWNESTNERFVRYRLWKHTGDGPDEEVYVGTDRRHEDPGRAGVRLVYEVTALDGDGRVLGHGDAVVTCC